MQTSRTRFALAALRRRDEIFCSINVWVFVGVLLVPLFIFMVIPTPHYHLYVDRARTAHSTWLPGAVKEDAMKIMIARDSRVYFGNHPVAREDLTGEIRECVRNGAEKKIYLDVDARARYTDVASVLDATRLAGISNIAFVTESTKQ